jgi:transglutaminase-like putative cysteine protease
MRFSLRHQTSYRYSVPVQLTPHLLRLTPRDDSVRNVSQTIDVQPQPSARRELRDERGNRTIECQFVGSTQLLTVDSRFALDTLMPAPLPPPMAAISVRDPRDGLDAYRNEPDPGPEVQRFASNLFAQTGGAPIAFLDQLTRTLFTRTRQELRQTGDAQPAASTLASWLGSCRDLSVLCMSACRCVGLASRFTSGYLAPLDSWDSQRQLHAWAEVFLPGVGWRGWDPSQGARVLDAHVPLCSAASQTSTMPIEGGFYFAGATVDTTLDYDIRISV